MKKLFVIGLLAAMFASCYEDKGNYDYPKMMTFEVPNMNSSIKNRNAVLGEPYSAYPVVNFYNWTNPEDTMRVTYHWVRTISGKGIDTLCEGRVFNWVPDRAGSAMGISVLVRDTLTGYVHKGDMQLTVTSQIGTGWALLHNYSGTTDMSFVRPAQKELEDPNDETKKYKVRELYHYPNYLSTVANPGISFGSNPVRVCWYANNSATKLVILQDNPVTIAGDSWTVEVDMAEEFAGGVPAGGFKDFMSLRMGRMILGNDGKIYLDQDWSYSGSFFTSRFMGVPLQDMETAEDFEVEEFADMYESWFGSVWRAHDTKNKRFLFVATNYYDQTALYPSLPKADLTSSQFVDDFSYNNYVDLANYDGYNYLFSGQRSGAMGLSPNSSGGGNSMLAFFFEKDGEVYLQTMKSTGIIVGTVPGLNDYVQIPNWGNIKVVKWSEAIEGVNCDPSTITLTKDTPHTFLRGKSQSSSGQAMMDYVYFAQGSSVYVLDFETNRLYEYYRMPNGANIKLLHMNHHDTELAVYADDNTFRTIKCAPWQLNNSDFDSKLTAPAITDVKDVQQIIYLRSNISMFYMPATSGGYNDRIVWTEDNELPDYMK